MRILKMLKPFAHVYAAMVTLILLSNGLALGAFAVNSLSGILLTGLLLAGLMWLTYVGLTAGISTLFSFKEPGILCMVIIGCMSGTAATALSSVLFPQSIFLNSIQAAILSGIASTILFWIFAYITGSLKKALTFLPKL